MDWRALGCAVVLELGLLGLAAFGGPHGTLGVVPWMLQFPGILLVLLPSGGDYFLLRAAAAALVQTGLWYLVLAALRRRRRRSRRVPA